ncbi:MAG: hypothetical protein HYW51_02390 [Candidatus Doudnabacteria bacterium]|nr:hypothetical protein [Candidatus Doudnabacteria bacterium]
MINWLKKLLGFDQANIISAKVIRIEKHPNADRLRIVELTDGRETIYPVVCGAYNFDVGDTVVLALPGASIPRNVHSEAHEPFILQTATIRGVESRGMIVSGFELGLDQSREPKILVLKDDVQPGSEFTKDMINHE